MASITLTWTHSDTSTGGTPSHYRIYRFTGDLAEDDSSFPTTEIAEIAGTLNTYEDVSAVAGSYYSYTVKAYNTGGLSGPADNINAKNILA